MGLEVLDGGESFWVRVSKSLYGNLEIKESGSIGMGRENRWSSWRKDVIEYVSGESGRLLWEHLERCIGLLRECVGREQLVENYFS